MSGGWIRDTFSLCVFLLCILGASAVIGWVTSTQIPLWYQQLVHPSIAPPNWVFAPVWTLLYISIAVSGWLVLRQRQLSGWSLTLYLLKLLLNFAWSFVFFAFHQIGWAFVEIIILWVVIMLNVVVFYRCNRWAAVCLVPYGLWVSFALILNGAFWVLNSPLV